MITKIFIAAAALLMISTGRAIAGGGTLYFTAQEIEAAYKYQEDHGERLRHPLKPNDCHEGFGNRVAPMASCSLPAYPVRRQHGVESDKHEP